MSGLFEGYQIVSPPFDKDDGRRLAEELFAAVMPLSWAATRTATS